MECLQSAKCSSPKKSRSIKKQWSSKRHTEDYIQELHREWPVDASQYELLEYAGKGAHAEVWKGRCKAYDEIVAIKRLDLDCNWDLTALIREATLMKKFHHPAVLPLYAAFVAGKELWFVTPYMGLGSVRSIMRKHFPLGLDEVVIATIMHPVLEALEYVHRNSGIHRDVKADNILVSEDGDVVLADFGVAAARMRQVSTINLDMPAVMAHTFVGTPCWMAPEVMEQTEDGYHTSADIWSFGITLIELAHGRPPMARLHPMRILSDTIRNPAPELEDRADGLQFSKAFKELVDECLDKDPERRPSAAALLNHKFFRMAHDADFLRQHFLAGLVQQGSAPNSPGQHAGPLGAAGMAGSPAAAAADLARRGNAGMPQQQQQPGGAWAAVPAGRFGSAPSCSGPTRLGSAWFFPPPVVQGHQLPAEQPEGAVLPAAAASPNPTTGMDSSAALEPGCQSVTQAVNQHSKGSTGGSSNTGSTLEQQLQPFILQQAAALRAGSGLAAGLTGNAVASSLAALRMGSTSRLHGGAAQAPVLEPYSEDASAEEEAQRAGSPTGACGKGGPSCAFKPGGQCCQLTQDQVEAMLAPAQPHGGVQGAPAVAVGADAVVRIAKSGSQQQDKGAVGAACSHGKGSTSPTKSSSFKEALSFLSGLKGRVLSPRSSAGKGAMSAAAAEACAASPPPPAPTGAS